MLGEEAREVGRERGKREEKKGRKGGEEERKGGNKKKKKRMEVKKKKKGNREAIKTSNERELNCRKYSIQCPHDF